MEWYFIEYYYLSGANTYDIAYEYVCIPDKVNNLTALRLLTLRLQGY